MSDALPPPVPEEPSLIGRLVGGCLHNKLVILLLVLLTMAAGLVVAPFDWDLDPLPRHPVPVDAIPDTGENQQIVFTEWPGRSPQDIDDQITYPLTTQLQGVRDVRTIRSISMFGFSSIYVIFHDRADFLDSRSRLLEKLNSLPTGTLPPGVQPRLGPDATAMGQVFWYTLEGQDPGGNPAGGWDLEELRTIQDWQVRFALQSAGGVAEVASIGGFVREYQVDVDPDAMQAHGVTINEVLRAVKASNLDVGAKTIEFNDVEYFVRGVGFIKTPADIEETVVKTVANVPILVKHVATVTLGPALRRGALDKEGAEAVGGVVVARYGANPLAVIKNVKKKIEEIAAGLPAKTLADGTVSKIAIVPFYDRTGLIYETLGTLREALKYEILVTVIVVILMVMHLRSTLLIGGMLPLAVLMCFVAMKVFGVEANVVALSGIAIAIGTIVDMGIVLCENILRHLGEASPDEDRLAVVRRAAAEVGGAVVTAVLTTIVSFLPVFVMTGAEGKLFKPLAFTKTFALISSILIALTVLPPAAYVLFCSRASGRIVRVLFRTALAAVGAAVGFYLDPWAGSVMVVLGAYWVVEVFVSGRLRKITPWVSSLLAAVFVVVLLGRYWRPLGAGPGMGKNVIFVGVLIGGLLLLFRLFQWAYPAILGWCLRHKAAFLSVVVAVLAAGVYVFLGPGRLVELWAFLGGRRWTAALYLLVPAGILAFGAYLRLRAGLTLTGAAAFAALAALFIAPATLTWAGVFTPDLPDDLVRDYKGIPYEQVPPGDDRAYLKWLIANDWDGRGKEFMPPLDEGSFLWMPSLSIHSSIGAALDVLAKQDAAFANIPEVESAVGKIGRVDSPLDPAPISMYETVINYKPRSQWRPHIKSSDDIWNEIVEAGSIPGATPVTKLQPIETRRIMLQTGMRASMGVKIQGPTLEAIEQAAARIEQAIRRAPGVNPDTVNADRIVAKPYITITPDRGALKLYNIKMEDFQNVVTVAVGGKTVTTTVEGRERFAVRVRYKRELRDSVEALERILVPGSDGQQVPLAQLAEVSDDVRGPQSIKAEDTFKTAYVTFQQKPGWAEVDVVERADRFLKEKQASGELVLPRGVSYTFAGTYEHQVRSQKTLSVIVPLALLVIFIILYLQFRSASTTLLVFSGIAVAFCGGFLMLWFYAQPWFLDFSVFGVEMRELFQVHTINLSVAVWVGFLALFGIATDDGVVMGTYLEQSFRRRRPGSIAEIRRTTIEAGTRRVRPCLMTTATTILALIPVLTSTGRGADVMVPMAIPSFGGMCIEILTMLVVPVLYCAIKEFRLKGELLERAENA